MGWLDAQVWQDLGLEAYYCEHARSSGRLKPCVETPLFVDSIGENEVGMACKKGRDELRYS